MNYRLKVCCALLLSSCTLAHIYLTYNPNGVDYRIPIINEEIKSNKDRYDNFTNVVETNKKQIEQQQQLKVIEQQRPSRGDDIDNNDDYEVKKVNLIVTYYSNNEGEIGGGNKDRKGKLLKNGCVALPKDVPYGSKVIIDGYDEVYTNVDTGGRIVWINDDTCHIDIFKEGYTSEELNKLGKHKESGYIYYKK